MGALLEPSFVRGFFVGVFLTTALFMLFVGKGDYRHG